MLFDPLRNLLMLNVRLIGWLLGMIFALKEASFGVWHRCSNLTTLVQTDYIPKTGNMYAIKARSSFKNRRVHWQQPGHNTTNADQNGSKQKYRGTANVAGRRE